MKVKALGDFSVPVLGRDVTAGEVVDVPDTQPDGSPLVWDPAYFEPVKTSTSKKEG